LKKNQQLVILALAIGNRQLLDNLPAASNIVGIWLNEKTRPYLRKGEVFLISG
jgi:hypothetical protein